MAIDFDTPQTSSKYPVAVTGTVPNNSNQGYVRITVTVTNATRDDVFYRTVSIPPTVIGYAFHNTYNLAIAPRKLSTDTATEGFNFSFTAIA